MTKWTLLCGLLCASSAMAEGRIDLKANEQPLPVTRDEKAIAKIPASYQFVEPGTLTVAISALNSPPLALLASDNRTRIGSDPDIARLLAGSLGLKLKLVPTAWEDWPLGITSGRYDVALVNIAVTEQRKEKFDFATYRVDSLAFSVKSDSAIASVKGPADLAGKKVIVGSGTNQERILLGWNAENEKAGRAPALPVYLTDDASGNLYIQSGRADVFFGPQSVSSYKAALSGKTKVVGLGPKKAFVATTTKKGNRLVYALQTALNGRGGAKNPCPLGRGWRGCGAIRSEPAGDHLSVIWVHTVGFCIQRGTTYVNALWRAGLGFGNQRSDANDGGNPVPLRRCQRLRQSRPAARRAGTDKSTVSGANVAARRWQRDDRIRRHRADDPRHPSSSCAAHWHTTASAIADHIAQREELQNVLRNNDLLTAQNAN